METLDLLIFLAAAVALFVLVASVQLGRLSPRSLLCLALGCGLALLAMLLTDWPWGVLSKFWADHSVLSAVLSTVLLVGVGFLAFEARDARVQSNLDSSVTAAGMGGVVHHLVDVEVALALASKPNQPDVEGWTNWADAGRPLRWLRDRRDRLSRSQSGGPSAADPRSYITENEIDLHTDNLWRSDLLDQGVRRIIGALRDWAPVLGRSRNGQSVLVDLGQLRNNLLAAQAKLSSGDASGALRQMTKLRRECRIMALALELGSGSITVRDEVLTSLEPLETDKARAKTSGTVPGQHRAGDMAASAERGMRLLIAESVVIRGDQDDPSGVFPLNESNLF